MASEREVFALTGPYFLTSVDWSNSHHRRSIAASLVQGVYQIERDRQNNRQGPLSLAPPWWQFFNFQLVKLLVDDHDVSCFGAIFQLMIKYPPPHSAALHPPAHNPPLYVVAFRGTIRNAHNRGQDFKLNLHCVLNNLENSTRFRAGFEAVRTLAATVGPGSIWLAGHSLGASIALTIGREMVKTAGIKLETYLFNSPFMSPPIERIKNEKVKLGLRFANSVVTAGIAKAMNAGKKDGENDPFTALCSWTPYLFINPNDPICSEYWGYFEHREKMESIGAGKIGRLATQHSIGSIVSAVRGKSGGAVHLIPCGYLTINSSPCQGFKDAHGIHQWWRLDLDLKYKLYNYTYK